MLFKSFAKLPLDGDTKETTGATQADIDIFVYGDPVDFRHAVAGRRRIPLQFQALDELDRENTDAVNCQSLSAMRHFKLIRFPTGWVLVFV